MRFAPTSVLDAGCGTGRVARELARRGVAVVGVDADASMVATARRLSPDLDWRVDDLCALDLGQTFELVVMAGNVPLFTPAGTQRTLVGGCARHLEPGGILIAGFSLDRGYDATRYDEDCASAGLGLVERWSTWSGEPFAGWRLRGLGPRLRRRRMASTPSGRAPPRHHPRDAERLDLLRSLAVGAKPRLLERNLERHDGTRRCRPLAPRPRPWRSRPGGPTASRGSSRRLRSAPATAAIRGRWRRR